MNKFNVLRWAPLFLLLTATPAQAQGTPDPALLVGEKSGALLAIVNPATLEIVARVPANLNPHEVATDGNFAYVSNSGAGKITVIDLAKQQQIAGIDLRSLGPIHSLVMADGKLYFASERSRTISRYDPATGEIDWTLGTGIPRTHMITVSDDARKIFLTSTSAGLAGILEQPVDANTGRVGDWQIHTLLTGPRAEGLDVSPDGRELWVNNVNDSTISVIDIASKKEVDRIALPTAFSNRLKFTPDGRHVFVSELRGTAILILDAATREEVKRIEVGGGSEGLLMDPEGNRAFVAVSTAGKVVVVDLDTLTITGEIGEFNNPDGMAWARR